MPNISNPDNDIVVGFKKEEEIIIDQLIHGSQEREVVLISGMGGLGKTTLARRVYEEKNVVNHFDMRVWCTVSQEYDCTDLLKKIYSQVCGHKTEIDSVAEELRKRLMGRRYLIVLDDIWSEEAWEELNRVFPSCDNRSRIVLTSRQESVVSDAKHICRLPFFTIDESWELLQVKLFKGNGCPEELENVGREISKKCGGLPLTVGLIAGHLGTVEKSEHMWRKFFLTLNSHVTSGDRIQSNDAIELSYMYLSYHLKPCLLYFAAFPEDEEIRVSNLIELWISEGFIIRMTEKGSVEDEAEDYLNHLVSSNLIMVSEKKYDGRFISCRVHDLVRDFCLTKAREEISLEIINTEKEWDPTLNFTLQRICFHMHLTSDNNAFELVPRNSSLHTVLVFHRLYSAFYNASWIAKNFEHLTILDLLAIFVDQSFLSEVSSLTHLRYLALKVGVHGNDDADDVSPLLLRNLKCLITLKLRSNMVHFPIFLGNMSTLRHMILHCVRCNKSCMEKSRSVMIEAIPACSKELQTWESRCPLTPMHEDLLRKLPCLKTLSCTVSSSEGFPEIDFLHHLEFLNLEGGKKVPHLLNDLKLSKFPSSIKEINFEGITLSSSAISIIAQLSNLEALILTCSKFEGLEWNVDEETRFPKLKYLQLFHLDIGIWNICSAESFPCLEQVILDFCIELQEVPDTLADILTLKLLSVRSCCNSTESSAKKIEEDVQGIGNEQLNIEIISRNSVSECRVIRLARFRRQIKGMLANQAKGRPGNRNG
ncbi:PREDICTED: putative late blight resistance protein homolog R1B-14 [Ipomoea nil]|uniref:putative late blight resistance protein homolog R1B-14 n=1 Tax=Ipomoea nil TaxID=35883 RepID=UPI000900CFEA|nr:PREDICTED: putative late blight resistance protein homolog R1B-14 [Ipomoea nil]